MTAHCMPMALAGALALSFTPLPAATGAPDPFEPEIRKFEVQDRREPPAPGALLFTGSSSIRLWTHLQDAFPGERVVNRGFGGSTMRDLLRHFDRVVVPYRPRVVVVYEGDNDLAQGLSPFAVALDSLEFLDRMREALPGTPVVFLAVKGSPKRRALLEAQRQLNDRLKSLAGLYPDVHFADTFSPLLDASGEPDPVFFAADQLHLNDRGYAAWAPVIAAALKPWRSPARP